MSTECEACKQKDALIEKLLDRMTMSGVHEGGPSVWESITEEEEDEVPAAVSAETVNAFRAVHDVSPYAGCAIVSGGEEASIEEDDGRRTERATG